MKPILSYLLLFCLTLALTAQQKIVGDGILTDETRIVGKDFTAIKSSGSFKIEIEDGQQDGKISIEGESNIIEKIETFVKNKVLYIQFESNGSYSYSKPIKIKLQSNQLKKLELAGSGQITTKGIQKSDEFTIHLRGSGDISALVNSNKINASSTGSGDIQLRGETQYFEINTRGSGNLLAYELSAKDVNISKSGSGNVKIKTNGQLDIYSTGSGNVFYHGNPANINSEIRGSGKIVNAN